MKSMLQPDLVDSVCQQDYPKDKMRIMVLDDSDDDTVDNNVKYCKKVSKFRI